MTQQVAEVVYHGYTQETGGCVVAIETPAGELIGLLPHHVKHSPDGFQWGYCGSGPAETARCLLLAALPDPHCPSCAGSRKVVLATHPDGEARPFNRHHDDPAGELVIGCPDCDNDGLAAVPYQDFKFEVVAEWEAPEWRMTRTEILSWLDNRTRRASS